MATYQVAAVRDAPASERLCATVAGRSRVNAAVSQGLARLWKNSQRLRFVVVGVWNTLFGYAVYALLLHLFADRIHYLVLLCIAHFLAVANAFCWHRSVTFQSSAHWPWQFVRFNVSYLGALAFSVVVLPLLVTRLRISPLVGGAQVMVLSVTLSYIVHKRFSFKGG